MLRKDWKPATPHQRRIRGLFVGAAQGATCGDREKMAEILSQKYGEARRGAGLATDQTALIEVWASDATGTFTVLATYPNGAACVVAEGKNWRNEPLAFTGQDG